MSDRPSDKMWCWAPNPADAGIRVEKGEVCEGCSDNENCMVGILWEKIAQLSEKYETRVYLLQKTEIRLKEAESALREAQVPLMRAVQLHRKLLTGITNSKDSVNTLTLLRDWSVEASLFYAELEANLAYASCTKADAEGKTP